MSNPRAACGAVEGFVRPSLRCSKSILHMILNLTFLMQVILSANLLCLLPFFSVTESRSSAINPVPPNKIYLSIYLIITVNSNGFSTLLKLNLVC